MVTTSKLYKYEVNYYDDYIADEVTRIGLTSGASISEAVNNVIEAYGLNHKVEENEAEEKLNYIRVEPMFMECSVCCEKDDLKEMFDFD